MTEKPSFASRWAARKQAVLAEEDAVEVKDDTPEIAEEPAPEPEKTEAEILTEFGLTDPDDMQAGDDFSGFMNSAIPARLRNRALRKLWSGNAALANLDGLLDYGDDFTIKSGVAENIATAYKVGKGYLDTLTEEDEIEEVAEDELDSDNPVEVATDSPAAKIESVRPPGSKPDLTPLATEAKSVTIVTNEDELVTAPRKRMNFRF